MDHLNARDSTGKVIFVLKDLTGGGAERMVMRLAAGVAESGVDTELVVFSQSGEFIAELPSHLKMVNLQRKSARQAILPLAAYLRKHQPTAIFTTLRHTAIAVALSHQLTNRSARLIIRESNHLGQLTVPSKTLRSQLFSAAVRWAYRQADTLTAVSNALREELRAFVGPIRKKGPKVVTRYNPVIGKDFIESSLHSPPQSVRRSSSEMPLIVTAGRLVPQKDHQTLLKAIRLVANDQPVRVVVFGEGPLRGALQEQCAELGLDNHVSFPGFSLDWLTTLAAADMFVLSSRWEGLPGVLIQALALQIPVVSTDCPTGPAEILENGKWGILTPVGEAEALAQGIRDTLAGKNKIAPPDSLDRFRVDAAIEACLQDIRAPRV